MIAAGADDVDGAIGRPHAQHLGAQCPGAARKFLGGLAAHLQAHQERAHLRRRRIAAGHDVERALGLVDAQQLAVAHLRQKTAEIVDIAAHVNPCRFAPCRPGGRAGSYIIWLKNSS